MKHISALIYDYLERLYIINKLNNNDVILHMYRHDSVIVIIYSFIRIFVYKNKSACFQFELNEELNSIRGIKNYVIIEYVTNNLKEFEQKNNLHFSYFNDIIDCTIPEDLIEKMLIEFSNIEEGVIDVCNGFEYSKRKFK